MSKWTHTVHASGDLRDPGVNMRLKTTDGEFHSHTDKGALFKFKSESDAKLFSSGMKHYAKNVYTDEPRAINENLETAMSFRELVESKSAAPGWMLKQDPALAKKIKANTDAIKALRKPSKPTVEEELQEAKSSFPDGGEAVGPFHPRDLELEKDASEKRKPFFKKVMDKVKKATESDVSSNPVNNMIGSTARHGHKHMMKAKYGVKTSFDSEGRATYTGKKENVQRAVTRMHHDDVIHGTGSYVKAENKAKKHSPHVFENLEEGTTGETLKAHIGRLNEGLADEFRQAHINRGRESDAHIRAAGYLDAAENAKLHANEHSEGRPEHSKWMCAHHKAQAYWHDATGGSRSAMLHHDLAATYAMHSKRLEGHGQVDRDFHDENSHHFNDINAAHDNQ